MASTRVGFASMRQKIRAFYGRRPVVYNVCFYCTMYAAADVTQQTIIRKPKYDFEGTARVAAVGAGFYGPLYHYWYTWLDKFVPAVGSSARVIGKKLILDQFVISPVCLAVFFIATSILERRENIFEEAIQKGPKTFLLGCFYWPFVQAVNFAVLPTHLRTTCVGVASFVWSTVVCYIRNSLQLPKDDQLPLQTETVGK